MHDLAQVLPPPPSRTDPLARMSLVLSCPALSLTGSFLTRSASGKDFLYHVLAGQGQQLPIAPAWPLLSSMLGHILHHVTLLVSPVKADGAHEHVRFQGLSKAMRGKTSILRLSSSQVGQSATGPWILSRCCRSWESQPVTEPSLLSLAELQSKLREAAPALAPRSEAEPP